MRLSPFPGVYDLTNIFTIDCLGVRHQKTIDALKERHLTGVNMNLIVRARKIDMVRYTNARNKERAIDEASWI